MSYRTARTMCKRLSDLLGLQEYQSTMVCNMLRGETTGMQACQVSLTPAEYRVVFNLMDWWAKDSSGEVDAKAKAYVALNLNSGASLTFIDRRS